MSIDTKPSQSAATDEAHWQQFRNEMPVHKKWAYFDHAAVAPLPAEASKRIKLWCEQALIEGDAVWPEWARTVEGLRTSAAKMINSSTEEIALVQNTTAAINYVADGFHWRPGDNLVIPKKEFPSNVYPWMNIEDRGVEVRQVPLVDGKVCLDAIDKACDEKTRIVSISWVAYNTGYRIDVDRAVEIAHSHGAQLMLDAIQGTGVFPIDVEKTKVDYLAADGHKWMCGPEGAGIFYVRKKNLESLRPMNIGWNSVKQGNDFSRVELNIRDTASRYEGGSQNMVGLIGLSGAIDTLLKFGLGPQTSLIAERILYLTDYLCEQLTDIGATLYSFRSPTESSGIVSFEIPDQSAEAIRHRLLEKGVVVSCRSGRLRASVHAYNNFEDIDRMINELKSYS